MHTIDVIYELHVLQYMVKKQGERLKSGDSKIAIISCILESTCPVSEPEIRKYLKNKIDVLDQGTTNKHIKQLKELGCVEKSNAVGNSRSNFWDVKTLENLQKIRLNFPVIPINSYEKSIMVIFKERGYSIHKKENLDFYIKLLLSVSLFDAFLNADINELIYKSEKIYLRDEGYKKTQNYENHVDNFLKLSKDANPDFKLPSDFSIYQRHISKEDFFKIFEIFQGKTEEMIKELDKAYKIFKEIDEDFDNKPIEILLNHFINHDAFKGIESPDEYGFFTDLKECGGNAFKIWKEEDVNLKNYERYHELISLQKLKVYSEIIKKYKQPSIFYISEDPKIILEFLHDFYKDQLL
jgi:hypothetical protein